MSTHQYGIHLISATRDREIQYWAVSDTRVRALAEVLRRVPRPRNWMITLTGQGLTAEEAEILEIRPGDARKLYDQGPSRS